MAHLESQLPVIQVVAPMLTAPLCVLLRRSRAAWILALVVTWGGLATSILMLQHVLTHGVLSYQMGGWPPPWGIELRIDTLNAFVLLIVSGISTVVLSAAPGSLPKEVPEDRHYLFYAAFLLCMTGLLGMTSAGDAFNVFVFLEISSLSSYTLVALGPNRRALVASFRYLMMGTVGGTFVLLGIGMLYMKTGTLNIVDLGLRLGAMESDRTLFVALACILVGVSVKLALFPLGLWLPNAYTFAPAEVSAFLAATATKVSYYVMARFLYRVFGPQLAFEQMQVDRILLPTALVAMFVGSLVAIYQTDLKRLLAYSSLAQVGYMVLGLALANVQSLTGGIVHLFNHALMKSGLFLALAAVLLRMGGTKLEDVRGLGRQMPWTMAAIVVGGLSLIGVPLTAGFVSKWYLVLGALDAGLPLVAGLILGSSLLAVIYIWKIVEEIYFQPAPEGRQVQEAPLNLLIPTWLLIGGTVLFGILGGPTADVACQGAELLLQGPPVGTPLGLEP